MAMDVHEQFASYKKRIFVDPGVLLLRHAWQADNPLSQLAVKLYRRFHSGFLSAAISCWTDNIETILVYLVSKSTKTVQAEKCWSLAMGMVPGAESVC